MHMNLFFFIVCSSINRRQWANVCDLTFQADWPISCAIKLIPMKRVTLLTLK